MRCGWSEDRRGEHRPAARSATALLGLALLLVGCGAESGPEGLVRVEVTPAVALLDSAGGTLQYAAQVFDASDRPAFGASVTWSSSDTAVAVVDAATGVVTAMATGTTAITATIEGVAGQAALEVYLPEPVSYVPGQAYFGRRQYVEYLPGDLPIVFSAPHGGYEVPAEISDRTLGTTTQDRNTEEMARAVRAAVHALTGRYPHVVISRLHRSQLDPNREVVEAAQGNPFAERAWREFHTFLEEATAAVEETGHGLYIDLHGHGHEIQRLELGYLLSASELASSDDALEGYETRSSVRALASVTLASFAEVIRGATSLGGLLQDRGYPCVPSPAVPDPGGNPYFSGGYDVARHGSRDGGRVSGIQIEMHFAGVRDTETNREAFAMALALALDAYLRAHLAIEVMGRMPSRGLRAFRWSAGGDLEAVSPRPWETAP